MILRNGTFAYRRKTPRRGQLKKHKRQVHKASLHNTAKCKTRHKASRQGQDNTTKRNRKAPAVERYLKQTNVANTTRKPSAVGYNYPKELRNVDFSIDTTPAECLASKRRPTACLPGVPDPRDRVDDDAGIHLDPLSLASRRHSLYRTSRMWVL